MTSRLRHGGFDHIYLSVDDVTGALDTELERCAELVCPPSSAVTFDRTSAFALPR